MRPRKLLISECGGDRATGYAMSTKVVRLGEKLLCAWIDASRQNRWAVVDPETGVRLAGGAIGDPGRDNHCGAALAVAPSGDVHAVVGGHHSPFYHYRWDPSSVGQGHPLDAREGAWCPEAVIEAAATYPSLVCDRDGTLHLAFRCQRDDFWTLDYCRRTRDGVWSTLKPLVRAAKRGYVYWTNALALGPAGVLHLVCANSRPLGDGSRYHGASHLLSEDGGMRWRQLGGAPLHPPVSVTELALIEGLDARDDRIEPPEYAEAYVKPGPLNYNYLQMLLSNPVIDEEGAPWVVVHNGLTGRAALYRGEEAGWSGIPLLDAVRTVYPGWRIHQQSALSCHSDGILDVVLMVAPEAVPGWGPDETELVRLWVSPKGEIREVGAVCEPDPSTAHWLPSLERRSSTVPALLYTSGRNAGGFDQNVNELTAEVWLHMPAGSTL